jgi:phage-related protein
MIIKGALTMNNQKAPATGADTQPAEDLRYYLSCPLRKNHARIPVTVCHKQKCLWLTSDGGKVKCGYGDPNLKPGKRPKVKKISRDGVV